MNFTKMSSKKYLKHDIDLALSILEEFPATSIKDVAYFYCQKMGIEYTDSIRSRISKLKSSSKDFINTSDTETDQYTAPVSTLSALKEDGTIMTIEEYCGHYGIDKTSVRSFKLVTHTGKGAYYNIASKSIETDHSASFTKRLLEDLGKLPNLPTSLKREKNGTGHLLVVDPADIHIGKLSRSFETGDSYNNSIAVQRVIKGVRGIVEKSRGYRISQILFIGGNDILHIDNPKRTTTSGTPQDTDGMWYENFLIAKQLYVDILSELLKIADVHFVYNPSNHDYMSGFFLADVIKTYFKNCDNITFDCNIQHRKYYTWKNNLIGTTHGDGAKEELLPMLMAQESKDWSSVKHRYIYTHHVHHKKSRDYIGVTVESLRSPSGTDGWHHRNGYQHSPKAVEGFIHCPVHGQVARLTHIF